MKFLIHGKVESDRRLLYEYLSTLKDKLYEVRVNPKQKQRSVNQNSYFHAVINKMLADELGWFQSDMKEFLKLKFGPKKDIVNKITGELVYVPMSTADYSVKQFEEFQEQIRIWAQTDLNIKIPLPKEKVLND